MTLVERHIVIKNSDNFKIIDELSFKSKNLYNYCNFILRQRFFENQKLEKDKRLYVDEYDLTTQLAKEKQPDYCSLPSQTSQQIIKLLFKNWKSFYKLCKTKDLNGRPRPPKYKDKLKGRNIIVFTNQQCKLKDGFIKFPKKKCSINSIQTKVSNFQQVRIIPQCGCYVIEVVYNKEKEERNDLNEKLYLGIDLGINNLATLIINSGDKNPVLINGRTLKSINQFYNKKKSVLMNYVGNKGTSNRLKKLELKRRNKINDYIHKTSRFIIKYCIENKIKNIVIGNNKEWKQNIDIGKVNNQKFVYIPYAKLIQQIQYKSELVGVNIIINEESYTSKIDHLVLEKLEKQEVYLGKRVHRGLFQSSIGKLINADVNGSIGILRKVIGDDFIKNLIDRGFAENPIRIDTNKCAFGLSNA